MHCTLALATSILHRRMYSARMKRMRYCFSLFPRHDYTDHDPLATFFPSFPFLLCEIPGTSSKITQICSASPTLTSACSFRTISDATKNWVLKYTTETCTIEVPTVNAFYWYGANTPPRMQRPPPPSLKKKSYLRACFSLHSFQDTVDTASCH